MCGTTPCSRGCSSSAAASLVHGHRHPGTLRAWAGLLRRMPVTGVLLDRGRRGHRGAAALKRLGQRVAHLPGTFPGRAGGDRRPGLLLPAPGGRLLALVGGLALFVFTRLVGVGAPRGAARTGMPLRPTNRAFSCCAMALLLAALSGHRGLSGRSTRPGVRAGFGAPPRRGDGPAGGDLCARLEPP